MERHTTQQSVGFVWQERTATEEYRERLDNESHLDIGHSHRRSTGYEYGQSRVALRPVIPDEKYPLDDDGSVQFAKRESKRKVRSDKGKKRKPHHRPHPDGDMYVPPRREYRLVEPVIQPSRPRYPVAQPVVAPPKQRARVWPKRSTWNSVSRNTEINEEIEQLLSEA